MMVNFYEEAEQESPLFLENSLVQLSILLLQLSPGTHRADFPLDTNHHLVVLIEALKEGYMESWTLDQMAAVAHINKYRLSHDFKNETGLSPYSWLQLYRLLKTQHDVKNTSKPFVHIALDHGFANVASYHRLFKRVYHQTPSQFRRRYQGQSN